MALPTMPLRATDHVNEAIELSKKFGKGVFSAVEYDFAISFAFTAEGEAEWKPVFEKAPMLTGNTRSQDQITAYHPNGAIYLRDIEDLRDAGLKTIYQGCAPFIMERKSSVDIDTLDDFKLAETLIKHDRAGTS
jgi:CMP-N,N'-diacetyllegionaminic acid synthase